MESVIQQRDTYRRMLHDAGVSESAQSPAKFRAEMVTSTPAAAAQSKPAVADDGGRSVLELEKLLSETSSRLEQKESALDDLLLQKKESDKTFSEKLDALTEQLAEARSQNARVSAQMEYGDEKEKLLQGNLDSFKKQVAALEQKNKVYACTVAKHEQSIAVLRGAFHFHI